MKAYIGCFGSGLGHTARMLEVARSLRRRGADAEFSTSGEAAALVEQAGFPCNRVPLADVRYSAVGGFEVSQSLLASPVVLGKTYLQVSREVSNIARSGADVVVSDSVLSTLLAAKALGLPAFTVVNQLNLASSRGREGPISRAVSVFTTSGLGKFWQLSNEVFLPDLPPPYTISEGNLWGSRVRRTRYVGFLTPTVSGPPDSVVSDFAEGGGPRIFWPISGPAPTRRFLLGLALECARLLSGEFVFAISGGDPLADPTPRRIPGGWLYGWCDCAGSYFEACDAVVSRAGHGTLSRSISLSKPSLLVPIPGQPEQEGNADKAARLGVAISMDQRSLSPSSLRAALRALIGGDYSRRATALSRVASQFDARRDICDALLACAKGHRAEPVAPRP